MFYSRNDVKRIQMALSEGKSIEDALYGSEQDFAGSPAAVYECLEKNRRSFSFFRTLSALIKKDAPAQPSPCAECFAQLV